MTLFKRHIGRRAAGVGLAAALVVLLVEAPAFAVTPTVGSFSPTSGPTPGGAGSCVVVVTGSNFTNPAVTGVAFDDGTGGSVTATFKVISDTELWTEVPALAGNGPISVTNASGTGSSSGSFIVANPGGCAPTADSFTPHCGPTDASGDPTTVTITGTNLLQSRTAGADTYFAPFGATADSGVLATQVGSATPTQLTVALPSGAEAGPISVVTFNATVGEGAAFTSGTFTGPFGTCVTNMSPSSGPVGTPVTITGVGFKNVSSVTFSGGVLATPILTDTSAVDTIKTNVPVGATTGPITLATADAPDGTSVQTGTFTVTVPPTPVTHSRSVSLRLVRHLVARGVVSVGDGFTACFANVPVKIQRKVSGVWKTVRTAFTTSTGSYGKRLPNRSGRYRSLAPKLTLNSGADICARAVSPIRRYVA
jgi:IPT/TIG domain